MPRRGVRRSRRSRRLRRSDRDLLAAYASAASAAAENLHLHQQLRGDIELANRGLARAYGDLALEKDKLESIVPQMGDGVIMLDRDHRIAVVDPAAEELLGIRAAKSEGDRPEDAMEGM